MGAPELLHNLRDAGLVLTLTPAGGLHVAPRAALTDDHRATIHTERDALVLALQAEAEQAPAPRRNGNPPTAPEIDPDRWCWPHSLAMNSHEIDTFTARLVRFTDKGVRHDDAEALADKLVLRDREGDDRRLCLECAHLQSAGRCGNWRRADVARDGLARELVLRVQRCPGYTSGLSMKGVK